MQKYLIIWTSTYTTTGVGMAGGQIVIETEKDPIRIVQQIRNDLGSRTHVSIVAI